MKKTTPLATPLAALVAALAAGTLAAGTLGAAPASAAPTPAALVGAAPDRPARLVTAERAIDGQYVVVLDESAADQARSEARAAVQGDRRDVQHVYATLGAYAVSLTDAQLAEVRRDPQVELVQEDARVSLATTQRNATGGLDRIDQRALPLSRSYTYSRTGSGVRAYVIDTGIYAAHREVSGRVAPGVTAIDDGRGTHDCHGHGTHVAGTVGGKTYGVAKAVTLVPVRVLDCQGSGTSSGVIAGMDWVAGNATRPAVANMSLGGGADAATDTAVARMVAGGVTTVVAAGNENTDACTSSPARAASAITVAASTFGDGRASFSNYGSCVDLFAPGQGITSAWIGSTTATHTISGTSMASPHVAGVAALHLQGSPSASPAAVTNALLGSSTSNAVSGANGSPNRLLFSSY